MIETKPTQLEQYFEAGVSLIKLNHWAKRHRETDVQLGKVPLVKNWPLQTYSENSIRSWMQKGNNVGVKLGEGWAVLDIDPRNGGLEGQRVLESKYGLDFRKFCRVATGRGDGGAHVYLKIPKGFRGMAKHPDIPGVDFKHHSGMQVVSAGSKHPEGGVYKWAPNSIPLASTGDCPQLLLEAYTVKQPPKELAGKDSESFGAIEPDELARALSHLDPVDFRDHDEWLTLMMSAHWLSGGEAREEFAEWSVSDPEFSGHFEAICNRWDSLSRDGGFSSRVVKGGFLYKIMIENGVGEHAPKVSLNRDFDELTDDEIELDQIETLTEEMLILKDMNAKHAMVNLAGRAFVTRRVTEVNERNEEFDRIEFSQARDMREMYANKQLVCNVPAPNGGAKTVMTTFFDFWRTHPNRREFDNVIFDPTMEKEFETRNGVKTLNLWEGFPFNEKMRGDGDWSYLKELIYEGIAGGNKRIGDYIVKWMAFSIQVRGRPQRTALVMRGPRGAGKGTLAREWLALWGLHGIATDEGDDLFGKYNADMEYKCGVFLDEAFWAGDKSTLGKLKARITEPKFRVEQKHQPKRNARNFLKIMMASNEDHVIPAAPNDRRFQMVDVSPRFKDDAEFFNKLAAQMKNGGREAFFYDLMTMDLGDYDPEKDRINTDALRSQVRLSYGEIAEWWINILDNGELPHQVGDWSKTTAYSPGAALRDHFEQFLGGARRGDWAYNFNQKFLFGLQRMMPGEKSIPKKRVKLTLSDDHYMNSATDDRGRLYCYEFPPLHKCRQTARELFGSDLFSTETIIYHGSEDEILEKVQILIEEMIEAGLEGEYELCAELNAQIDEVLLDVEGGDLI